MVRRRATMRRLITLSVLLLLFLWPGSGQAGPFKTGFLVVAPDRGFLGNQETQAVFDEFKKDYPASLALVGRDYNGLGSEYSAYISRAVAELETAGITEIMAIPLFLSSSDPVFKKITPYLPAYAVKGKIHWATPMKDSHLTAQILLDRVDSLSQDSDRERLVVLGVGAIDEESERSIRADLQPLVEYVKRYRSFKEVQIGIYYDRDAEAILKEKKNQAIDDLVTRMAAKKGKTLVVPFFIGPKFDNQMSLTRWFANKFNDGLQINSMTWM